MFGVQREGLCWGPRLGSLAETSGEGELLLFCLFPEKLRSRGR